MGRTKKHTPSPDQIEFPFSFKERLDLIDGAQFPVSNRVERSLVDLLRAIEKSTGAKGCNARVAVLAHKARLGESTVRRLLKVAEDLGVLAVTRMVGVGGQGPSQYTIDYVELRKFQRIKGGPEAPSCFERAPSQIGSAPSQYGSAPSQIESASKERALCTKANTTATPYPAAVPQAAADNEKHAAEDPWADVREALQGEGYERAPALVRKAQRMGLTPADVTALIAEYQANRRLFRSAGAIDDRITSGSWPAPGVRPLETIEQQAAEAASRAASARQARLADEQRLAAERAELARLEAEHGAELDRMPRDALLDLAAESLPPGQLSAYQKFGPAIMRRELLQALAGRASPC